MKIWIDKLKKETRIKIYDKLAIQVGLYKKEKRLIWTIKHGMRWIKMKNPELH